MTREETDAKAGQRVLVVDDDDAVMTSIAHIVKHQGFVPVTASDWVGALEAIEQDHPEVILLDLNMPHVDGVALLKFIREKDLTIPVIVVSAFIDEDSRARLIKLGVSAFVAKPFTMAHLKDEIQRAIGPSLPPREKPVAPATPTARSGLLPKRTVQLGKADSVLEPAPKRRRRVLRKPKIKPKVLFAVGASCILLAALLGVLNFYLTH